MLASPLIVQTLSLRALGLRHSSTNALAKKNLAKLLVFPLTHDKSFLYFHYNEEKLLNSQSQIVKYENKAVNLATKAWNKLRDSDKSYNKKIVQWATKLLEQTPWSEDSLRSIPSRSALLRQVRRVEAAEDTPASIKSLEKLQDDETVVKIPVYYPSTILTQPQLQEMITKLSTHGEAYHKRQAILTGLGVPISLPFALVPLIPNIPGFYLAYRFYCNFKAMGGATHLREMQRGNELMMKDDPLIDQIYEDSKRELDQHKGGQGLLLNEGIIDRIVETFAIPQLRSMLIKALRQERKTLEAKQ